MMNRFVGLAAALLALAASGSSSAADTALVGQWHLDEGRGATVSDSSGNNNNGTITGGAQWVQGRFGAGLDFDGQTGRVQILDNAAIEPSSSLSVSAWVKSAGSPGLFRYVVAKGATGCIAASYGLYTGPNGGLEFYLSHRRGTAYTPSPDAGTGVWDGRWHMVVGTYDGATIRLFVDGNEVGSGTARTGTIEYLLLDSNDLFIGDYPGCVQHNFQGVIDEINIWSRALSAAEVQAAFSQANQGPSGGGDRGGGGPTTTPPQTGAPRAGSGGTGARPPVLSALRVSPSAFSVTVRRRHRSHGTTVSYVDTQSARATLSVLIRRQGVRASGRCVPAGRRSEARHARCYAYLLVGSFFHTDRAGRNSLHFARLPARTLVPGKYRLAVSATANGLTGRTVSVPFTVLS
jgi:hypothetical protein